MDVSSPMSNRPRIGVSACLAGDLVRYDGDHQCHEQIVGRLARNFELIKICPEIEIGLGVPREPIQLEARGQETRLVAVQSRQDHTETMQRFGRRTAHQVETWQLCGYVLKSKSPSCGLEQVKRWYSKDDFQRDGTGIFATALQQHAAGLPVIEDRLLDQPGYCQHFITQVNAFHQLRTCLGLPWDPERLRQFHATYQPQLQARHPGKKRQLDELLARIGDQAPALCQATYRETFLQIMTCPVTP